MAFLRQEMGFPGGSVAKESICDSGDRLQCGLPFRIHLPFRRPGLDSWVRKIPWRKKWQPTPVFWPGKSHGQRRNLVVHEVAKVRHDIVTKPPPSGHELSFIPLCDSHISLAHCNHYMVESQSMCS